MPRSFSNCFIGVFRRLSNRVPTLLQVGTWFIEFFSDISFTVCIFLNMVLIPDLTRYITISIKLLHFNVTWTCWVFFKKMVLLLAEHLVPTSCGYVTSVNKSAFLILIFYSSIFLIGFAVNISGCFTKIFVPFLQTTNLWNSLWILCILFKQHFNKLFPENWCVSD